MNVMVIPTCGWSYLLVCLKTSLLVMMNVCWNYFDLLCLGRIFLL
jgi:hypothetical protein